MIARHLEREETEARKTCFLKTWSDGHGSTYGRFKIPDLTGTILTTALEAYANPNRPDPIPRTDVTPPQVYGQAFCELLEHLPADRLPQTGGINATVLVTMTLDTLLGGLQAANILGTDTLLSPGQARRLAAAAGIIPAVLTANPNSSTSADDAPTPNPNASPWPSAKAGSATSRAANAPPPGATPTTDTSGAKAAAPPSTTAN